MHPNLSVLLQKVDFPDFKFSFDFSAFREKLRKRKPRQNRFLFIDFDDSNKDVSASLVVFLKRLPKNLFSVFLLFSWFDVKLYKEKGKKTENYDALPIVGAFFYAFNKERKNQTRLDVIENLLKLPPKIRYEKILLLTASMYLLVKKHFGPKRTKLKTPKKAPESPRIKKLNEHV